MSDLRACTFGQCCTWIVVLGRQSNVYMSTYVYVFVYMPCQRSMQRQTERERTCSKLSLELCVLVDVRVAVKFAIFALFCMEKFAVVVSRVNSLLLRKRKRNFSRQCVYYDVCYNVDGQKSFVRKLCTCLFCCYVLILILY